MTVPSTGIFSPGRTTMMSPTWTSSTGNSASTPSRITRAVLAWSPMIFRIASEVLPLAMASKSLPAKMKVIIMTAVSKNTAACVEIRLEQKVTMCCISKRSMCPSRLGCPCWRFCCVSPCRRRHRMSSLQ